MCGNKHLQPIQTKLSSDFLSSSAERPRYYMARSAFYCKNVSSLLPLCKNIIVVHNHSFFCSILHDSFTFILFHQISLCCTYSIWRSCLVLRRLLIASPLEARAPAPGVSAYVLCFIDSIVLGIFKGPASSSALSFCSSYISVPVVTSTVSTTTPIA